MVVEIDHEKCHMCGGYSEPVCVEACPTTAITKREKTVEVTEFLCEDCNECAFKCPDKAVKTKKMTF